MKILPKENDLYNFITEKVEKTLLLSDLKIYEYYSKIIFTCIKISIDKLLGFNYIYHCVKIVDLLFWFLINFSKNIKLTMFLCDRAIILYTEFVNMFTSSNYKEEKELDILEVKEFVYKKTIGPIKITKIKKYCLKKNFINFCQITKYLYIILVKEYIYSKDCNILTFMDRYNEINSRITEIFFNNTIFNNKNIFLLEYFITNYTQYNYIFLNNFINVILTIYQENNIDTFNRKIIDNIHIKFKNDNYSRLLNNKEVNLFINEINN